MAVACFIVAAEADSEAALNQHALPLESDSASASRRADRLFWLLAALSLLLRFLVAWKGHMLRHPDEIFQTIEQSHRMVFGFGIVPWEYVEGIRWIGTSLFLMPSLLLAKLIGAGPEFYMPLAGLVLSCLSMLPVIMFYRLMRQRFDPIIAVLACLVPLFWYENLDFASSTLSDAISAVLIACAALTLHWLNRNSPARLIIGFAVAVALTFAARFHLTPALCVLGLVALWQLSPRGRLTLIGALIVYAILLAVLDMAFGMYPFQHVWLNFYRNIVDGVAESFGVEPPHFYLHQLWQRTGLAGIIVLAVLLATIRTHWRLSVPAMLLIVAFSFVAHKEYRFYYPATLLLTFAAGWGLAEIWQRLGQSRALKRSHLLLGLTWSCAILALAVWPHYNLLLQQRQESVFAASQAAAGEPDICGLAYAVRDIWWTGGHTYFHRDVPLEAASPDDLIARGEASRFNYVMAMPDQAASLGSLYTTQACWTAGLSRPICLFKRPGNCS